MSSRARQRVNFAAAVAGFWAVLFGAGWWLAHFIALPGDNDFHNYVVGASVGLAHGWSHVYDLGLLRGAYTTFTGFAGEVPFIYRAFASPLPLAWVVVPFTFLPLPAGYAIWSALMAAAIGFTWYVLAPGTGGVRFLQLGGALVMAPVAWELRLGGDVALVMAAVAGSYALLRRGQDVVAGVVLAGICFKPNLAFLAPVALLTLQRWRAFASWAVVSAVIAGLAVLALGGTGLSAYLALLRREDSLHFNWYLSLAQFTGPGTWALVAGGIVALLGVAVLLRRRRDVEGAFAAAIAASVVASPYLHAQDFAMLLPAAWLAWRALEGRWRWALLLFVPAAELVFITGSQALLGLSLGLVVLLGRELSKPFPEPTRDSLAANQSSGIAIP